MSIFTKYQERYDSRQAEEFTIQEYLDLCKEDKMAYATSAERMLHAIGTPKIVDTRDDMRKSRLFMNRKIKIYEAFADFYGMEDTIESIVSFFKHAAQGLEEKKQVLYLLGPVGGGKSSLAEKLKDLIETVPFYALKAGDSVSPMYESPLGLFDKEKDGELLKDEYGIATRYLGGVMSSWVAKRLKEYGGDISQFKVVKIYPSRLDQIGVTKTEPGDENNQDISSLVGKVDIRKLEDYSQDDPDAYNYSGGLNVTTQGMLEFVEMFKAPIKMLHPLLTATQEGNYNGTENGGAMPYQGVILAHSNESEWTTFRGNKNNEAFLDRVYIVKVPYCLQVTEEAQIYQKLIENSSLSDKPCAPGVMEMMAQFSVLTRLKEPENSTLFSKMEVYDGKNLKDKDPKAKSLQEYKDYAGVDEGMNGSSTRFAYKILSKTYNFDSEEVAANPVHLMYVLQKQIQEEQMGTELEEQYITFVQGVLAPKYAEHLGDEIQKAYLESYSELGQNIFDRYIVWADAWIQDLDYRDPDTGEQYDREALNEELEKIEKHMSIINAKDFRNTVVTFVLRERANTGENVSWKSYAKMREVIERKLFSSTEDLLPVISFNKKSTSDEQRKHNDFVDRMRERGYSRKQVELLVNWYMRYKKHN